MLMITNKMHQLRFSELMQVYEEGNLENGQAIYPCESKARQAFLAEQDFYNYLTQIFFTTPNAQYAVWLLDGHYASALRLEPYQDGLLLSALETRPSVRRKGCAEELVKSVLAVLSEQGNIKVYSHVNKSNTASLNVHNKCGFRILQDYAVYADGSVMHNSYTLCKET